MKDEKNLKYLVRIMNTDLDGKKQVVHSLKKIKGVSHMFANAVCRVAGVQIEKKAGHLSDAETKKIDEIIQSPGKFGIPAWMFNRQGDPENGEDKHLLTTDLDFTKQSDFKLLQKTKSYRGLRLQAGLTTRGQRTKSNFRKSKSTGKGGSLGVKRKKK